MEQIKAAWEWYLARPLWLKIAIGLGLAFLLLRGVMGVPMPVEIPGLN